VVEVGEDNSFAQVVVQIRFWLESAGASSLDVEAGEAGDQAAGMALHLGMQNHQVALNPSSVHSASVAAAAVAQE